VLEALKERGEVVSKMAYSDWQRAGGYSRMLTQHAIRMVQRNMTPGGDKNGADINLALDALEMAFTHPHINAFVIVGGDSDFISLVEKLKQYDKKVFVVGGRQFTSQVMQKNCHEFIAYENLVGRRSTVSGPRRESTPSGSAAEIARAEPLVKRALKVLADREVTPQLGLLKSTLLQLDSTFSERDYGVSSFRDFMEKMAKAGLVTLRHSGRSTMVDAADSPLPEPSESVSPVVAASPAPVVAAVAPESPAREPLQVRQASDHTMSLLRTASPPPRWPMYVRQIKHYLRTADPSYDERKWGFASLMDFLRALQREGVFRIERDRRGQIRLFPGTALQSPQTSAVPEPSALPEYQEPIDELLPEPLPAIRDEAGELALSVEHAADELVPVEPEKPRRSRKGTSTGRTAARKATTRAPRRRKTPVPVQ
jgi:hypothetical protein